MTEPLTRDERQALIDAPHYVDGWQVTDAQEQRLLDIAEDHARLVEELRDTTVADLRFRIRELNDENQALRTHLNTVIEAKRVQGTNFDRDWYAKQCDELKREVDQFRELETRCKSLLPLNGYQGRWLAAVTAVTWIAEQLRTIETSRKPHD